MKRHAIFFLLSLLIAGSANAVNQVNSTLARLGVQGNNAYFSVEEGFELFCRYNVVYVPITTEFGKFAYAELLTAKALNKEISRIDYVQGTDNICVLRLIEIND